MSGYVTLMEAEQVQSAANRMASAADPYPRREDRMIKFSDLATLPTVTLEVIARALAAAIDSGLADRRPVLERVLGALEERATS